MVVAPGDAVGGERVRPEAAIAIDGRCGKRGAGCGVFQQAGEEVSSYRRQMFARVVGHEQVVPVFIVDKRLMQVPAAGIAALERRQAHEGREMTHATADLAGRRAEQHDVIGGLQRRPRRKRALDLARPPLVLDGSQRQSESFKMLSQCGEHRLHQIHVRLGMIGEAGLGRCGFQRSPGQAGGPDALVAELIFGDAQEIPLDLQPDHGADALLAEPLEHAPQQVARREVKRHAAVEVFVAQHPADAGRPGQHAKRSGIGNDGQVGRTGHFGKPHPTSERERGKGAGVRGVEGGGRDVDVVAGGKGGEKRRHRHRLGARGPVRIGPGQAHELDIVLFDAALELIGLAPLLVRPQSVPFDEADCVCHPAHPCRAARRHSHVVMPGLVPGIHVFLADGRNPCAE